MTISESQKTCFPITTVKNPHLDSFHIQTSGLDQQTWPGHSETCHCVLNQRWHDEKEKCWRPTLRELSTLPLRRTGSLAKNCRDETVPSWASFITACNFRFWRSHILITPDDPPAAKNGCPSEIHTPKDSIPINFLEQNQHLCVCLSRSIWK